MSRIQNEKLVSAADTDTPNSPASQLRAALETLRDCPSVGDVRGIGLLWAVEFVADKASKKPFPPAQTFSAKVGEAARERGLLVYPMQGCVDGIAGDHILIAPPAVITGGEIQWSVEQLRKSIEAAVPK